MRRAGHVGVDTTMGSVCATALVGSLLNLDVCDVKLISVKTLSNSSIALGVLQQTQNVLNALAWPASLCGSEGLGLGGATNASSESAEGDGLLVLENVLQVLFSALQVHAANGHGGLTRVLEVDAEGNASGLGRLVLVDVASSVCNWRHSD